MPPVQILTAVTAWQVINWISYSVMILRPDPREQQAARGGMELAPSMILQPFSETLLPLVTNPNLLLEVGKSQKHQDHANR
jgi:hypothetical protein